MKSRIMYIESKSGGLTGPARIGRVMFSKTRATIYYRGKAFQKQDGFKSNFVDVETGNVYWISGPRKDGRDALYATHVAPAVDADVHVEYWSTIRGLPVPVRRAPEDDDAPNDAASGPVAHHDHFNSVL